jgi:hypothetical protein
MADGLGYTQLSSRIGMKAGQVRRSGDLRRSSLTFREGVCGNEIVVHDVSHP